MKLAAQCLLDNAEEIARRVAYGRVFAPGCPLIKHQLPQFDLDALKGGERARTLLRLEKPERIGKVEWLYSTYVSIYIFGTRITYVIVHLRIPKMGRISGLLIAGLGKGCPKRFAVAREPLDD